LICQHKTKSNAYLRMTAAVVPENDARRKIKDQQQRRHDSLRCITIKHCIARRQRGGPVSLLFMAASCSFAASPPGRKQELLKRPNYPIANVPRIMTGSISIAITQSMQQPCANGDDEQPFAVREPRCNPRAT